MSENQELLRKIHAIEQEMQKPVKKAVLKPYKALERQKEKEEVI